MQYTKLMLSAQALAGCETKEAAGLRVGVGRMAIGRLQASPPAGFESWARYAVRMGMSDEVIIAIVKEVGS